MKLQGNTTLDTSAMIEFLIGSDLGEIIRDYLENLDAEESVHNSLYSISEMYYVLNRLKGDEFATESLERILDSNIINVNSTLEMAIEAGRLKSERAISIADCSCLSTAKITDSKAVFARREKEIAREMKRKSFGVEMVFLDDFKIS